MRKVAPACFPPRKRRLRPDLRFLASPPVVSPKRAYLEKAGDDWRLVSFCGHITSAPPCDKLTRRVKFRFSRNPNHRYESPHPVLLEGALAIVTERWDGMRWTLRHRARNGIAGRDKLREWSSGRADERCRSVRRNRVVLAPQGWRQACEPVRRRRWQQSVAHRGEYV